MTARPASHTASPMKAASSPTVASSAHGRQEASPANSSWRGDRAMIRSFLIALAALALCGEASARTPRELMGRWTGEYSYSGGRAVDFDLRFTRIEGEKLIGASTELDCAECAYVPQEVGAEWRGYVDGDRVWFIKIYDGRNRDRWVHTVIYEGRL